MVEMSDDARPPARRKRIHQDGRHLHHSTLSSNGSAMSAESDDAAAAVVAIEDGSSSVVVSTRRGGGSTVNGNKGGESRAARRERIMVARRKRRRSTMMMPLIILGACCIMGFVLVAFLRDAPARESSAAPPASSAKSHGGDDGAASGSDSEELIRRILSETPADSPLAEEQEQRIIRAARDELDRFPVSIGIDGDGSDTGWETIEHPGIEALKFFEGDSYKPREWKRERRAKASELAGVLAGKKLWGEGGDGSSEEDGDGLEEGKMRVPKFWDPAPYRIVADERERRSGGGKGGGDAGEPLPREGVRRYLGNFGSRLMTPAEARSIGSRIPASGNGNNEKNDGEMLETIFVAVASYRDWQCSGTVESAFARASHPERIRVAVVDQIRMGVDAPCSVPPSGACEENPDQPACRHASQIDYLTIDAELSIGPVFARHLGHRLYRGEYFAMQSDAHVSFVTGWDDEIVEQWHSARNEMAILSTYLSGTDNHIDLETGQRTSKSRPIMCMSDFEGEGGYKHLRHGQQPEGVPYIHDMPTLNPFWAAGFSFGRGHFVVNVPYDQHLPWIFQGEEISIGLRGFSYGYDFYSPERSVCYHFYGRKDIPMFWENTSIYRGSGMYGMNRLNAIIRMEAPSINGETKEWIQTDERKYGIGKARDLQRFFDVFGIHAKEQRVEQHLCTFVGRPMQKEFIPFLRTNEMGLDYDKITYRFVDPDKH